MAGPGDRAVGAATARGGSVRDAVFAGRFYPSDAATVRREVDGYLAGAAAGAASGGAAGRRWIGGIVPHAGWVCSAALAGATIAQVAASGPVDVVVVFGAIHTPLPAPAGAALDCDGRWAIPGGVVAVAAELRERLLAMPRGGFAVDERFHVHEHAVEVELPLIAAAFPGAAVLPVEVPVSEAAVEIGQAVAATTAGMGSRVVFLASSDLTHYGPSYRFTPAGVGPGGLAWAKQNDRRVLELACGMAAERIVPEVREHHNACGGGAIAAMLAAGRACGATAGTVLRHANSVETLASVAPQPPIDAVGYAAVVVG